MGRTWGRHANTFSGKLQQVKEGATDLKKKVLRVFIRGSVKWSSAYKGSRRSSIGMTPRLCIGWSKTYIRNIAIFCTRRCCGIKSLWRIRSSSGITTQFLLIQPVVRRKRNKIRGSLRMMRADV